tara:strand:- start:4190 stop:4549 length:360 start_codon:yes stop_codon:yes gene_type:complete
MRITTILLITLLSVMLGCSGIKFPGVHKIPIQQGNILEQEMIDKLRPGMTKSQVRFVLGTPLITDSFNQQRWIYLYSMIDARSEKSEKMLAVYFDESDELQRLSGDYTPSAAELQLSTP